MNHLFIINPMAGRGNHVRALKETIAQVMEGRGQPFDIQVTGAPMEAPALVRTHTTAPGLWRVYACGGDGTLNEVVCGAYGLAHVSVAHYPCGTGNDFIKVFGRTEPFLSLEALLDGDEHAIDVMEAAGRKAINICSVGFDANVAAHMRRFHALLRVGTDTPYWASVVYNLLRGVHRRYHVSVDGETYDNAYTMLVAANGRVYGGGFQAVPDASPCDGRLTFLLVRKISRLGLATLVKVYAQGGYRKMPSLITPLQGQSLSVSSRDKPFFINIDGEIVTSNAVVIRLCEQKIRFVAPKGLEVCDLVKKTAHPRC